MRIQPDVECIDLHVSLVFCLHRGCFLLLFSFFVFLFLFLPGEGGECLLVFVVVVLFVCLFCFLLSCLFSVVC